MERSSRGSGAAEPSDCRLDDEVTELLMSAFYRNWQAGMGKAEALQAAQAELRETHPSPFYWAAFVVNGDAGEVSQSSMWAWLWVIAGMLGLLGVVGLMIRRWRKKKRETQVTVTQGK